MNKRKFFSTVGLSYFFMIVVTLGIEVVIDLIVAAVAPWVVYRYPSLIWVISFLPQYCVAMPVCILILRRLPAMKLHENRLEAGNWFRALCIALFLMEVGNLIGNLLCELISRVSPLELSSDLSDMMSTGSLGIVFLFTVVIGPIMEELVFRKVLIDRTIVFGDRTAILVSGLLFGLVHGNLYQFFYAFFLGCLFAYIYIRTGRIRNTISFHMVVNFLGGFVGTVLAKQLSTLQDSASASGNLPVMMSRLVGLFGLAGLELLTLALAIVGLVFFCISLRRTTLLSGEYEMSAKKTANVLFGNVGMILFLIVIGITFVFSMI
ncbi:MAG: CPBP family intramembrane metalloprotease [Lachnospiraceae bacterium]|nr:CPBP family intramembrane metalloprotease [Lachnospiraceae bacterium]